MSEEHLEALVRRLRPRARARSFRRDLPLVRTAVERYGPLTLNELYMAVRAVDRGGGARLVGDLEAQADRDPERALADFLETPPAAG